MKVNMAKFTLILVSLLGCRLTFPGVSAGAIDPGTAVGIWLFDDSEGEIAVDFQVMVMMGRSLASRNGFPESSVWR